MKTKADYKRALEVVGKIIREWDPHSLIASGSPVNEFDSEIATVVAQVPHIKSADDAALAISRVFTSSFEVGQFTPDACAEVGSKLFVELSAQGLIE